MVADIVSRAQEDAQLRAAADPALVATVLVVATDGLKDLSDLLDGPRAKQGYLRRVTGFAELIQALLLSPRDDAPPPRALILRVPPGRPGIRVGPERTAANRQELETEASVDRWPVLRRRPLAAGTAGELRRGAGDLSP